MSTKTEKDIRTDIAYKLAEKAKEYRFYAEKELRGPVDRAHAEQAAKYLYAAEVVEKLITEIM